MSIQPQEYKCLNEVTNEFEICEIAHICAEREINPDFEYVPNTAKVDYLENWYVTLDLMCESTTTYNKVASFYFLGFMVGAVTFFLPDMLGRRKTMLIILPIYSIASALSIFSDSLLLKTVGFFL
jgi:MFS family permease